MKIKLSPDELAKITKRPGYGVAEEFGDGTQPKRSKFGNQPVNDETGRYDSRLEARHAAEFRLLLKAGAIQAYARQVEVMLPGNVKMIVDHALMTRNDDGTWTLDWRDSKGAKPTPDWRNKQKQAKAQGIEVITI